MIFRSAVCRTTARYRPAPTLFYFPGLVRRGARVCASLALMRPRLAPTAALPQTSKPFHDDHSQFPWAELLERGYETILEEYLSVASRPGGIDTDYRLHHGEKTLHSGDWRWFSYVSKGVRQDRFRECVRAPRGPAPRPAVTSLRTAQALPEHDRAAGQHP